MRTSIRSRASRYAGDLHAKVVDYTQRLRFCSHVPLHICYPVFESNWSDRGHFSSSREAGIVDDSTAVCIRHELPYGQVLAGSEQDYGDGLDSRGSIDSTYSVYVVGYDQVGVGAAWRSRGS